MSQPPPHQHLTSGALARHHHLAPYCAIVLDGVYEEVGDGGRIRLEPGDLAVHAGFEAHANVIGAKGALIVNLPDVTLAAGYYRSDALDTVAQLVRSGHPITAEALPLDTAVRKAARDDWPDLLARDLRRAPDLSIEEWAATAGLSLGHISVGFRKAYGMTPKRFRHEAKATRAASHVAASALPLASIALDSGFADQAHMTHSLRSLFGVTPARIRSLGPAGHSAGLP